MTKSARERHAIEPVMFALVAMPLRKNSVLTTRANAITQWWRRPCSIVMQGALMKCDLMTLRERRIQGARRRNANHR
jgi:hypothetical protein